MNKQILQMMFRVKLIHWIIIVLAAFLWGTKAMIAPVKEYYQGVKLEAEQVKARMIHTESATKGIEDFDAVIESGNKHFEEVNTLFLEPGSEAEVISVIIQRTEELGISIRDIKPIASQEVYDGEDPEDAEKKPRLKTVLFKMNMVSNYKSLGLLLERAQEAELLISIQELKIRPSEKDPGLLNVDLVFAAFEKANTVL